MKFYAAALLAALGAAGVTRAATAQDIDRSKRPDRPPPPTFKFPKVSSHVLSNGLRLLVTEDHSLSLVAVRVVIGADSTMDPPGQEGLYALTLGAMREATTSKTPDQLAEAFADVGAAVTPTAFTATSGKFIPALELMGDMLMHPTLDQAGVDRRKALQSAAVRRIAQNPVTLPRHLFNAVLYGAGNGYVRSLIPTDASVASLTRDDVAAFYGRFIRPQTTTIIVSGDVRAAAALAAVIHVFGGWSHGGAVTRSDTVQSIPVRPTAIYLYDNRSPQAYVYVGNAGPARTSPDYAAADAMGAISASRMLQTLRERRSFMYAGASGIVARRAPLSSSFVGSGSVNATKADSALVEWLALLRGLRAGRSITAQELETARRNRIGVLPARMEGPDSLANRIAELVRDNVPLDYYDRYVARMANIGASDIAAAAAKYIDADHLIIVVAGDRRLLEPALRKANIAPVVVVDVNGNPMP